MVVKKVALYISLSIFFFCLTNGHAEEKFIIGVEDNRYFPHYSYEDGEYIGIGRQLLDAFFTEKGYEYEYRALPVARLFQSFVDNEFDFKYPDNPIWSAGLKEGKKIVYSVPVMPSTDGVMVLPENFGKKTFDEIKLLATIRGFTAPQWTEKRRTGKVIMGENDSSKLLVKQALAGRIEGAYANIDILKYVLREIYNKPDALVFDTTLPYLRQYYHLSSIRHPNIIEDFNAWVQQNEEYINSLKNKYGITDYPNAQPLEELLKSQ